MRDFGVMTGQELIPLLATLWQEGALAAESETQALVCVHEITGAKTTLYFCQDFLIRAESPQSQPDLIDIFYGKRLLNREQKEQVEAKHRARSDFSVGKYVIEQGWISQSDVAHTLIGLIEILAYEVLQWETLTVHLTEAASFLPQNISNIPPQEFMPVSAFVAEAEKNLPVLRLMQQELQDFEWVLKRLKEAQRGELSTQQAHVYRYVNHQRTLAQLLQISDLGYFETLAATYQLIKWGYLGKGARSGPLREKSPTAPLTSTMPVPQAAEASKYNISQRHFLKRDRGAEIFGVFQRLFEAGYTEGQLVVESQSEPVRATFEFRDRKLLHASNPSDPTRLADLVLRRKQISATDLKAVLKRQRERDGIRLGQLLIESDHVSPADLLALVYHQMSCVLYPVLAWPEVKYYFAPLESEHVQNEVQVPIQWLDLETDPHAVLEDSSEYPLFAEAYKALPLVLMLKRRLPRLQATPVRLKVQQHQLSEVQRAVWNLIDGFTSFQDILLASEAGYLETYTALYQMLSTHLIGVKQKQPPLKSEKRFNRVPEPRRFEVEGSSVQKPRNKPLESVAHHPLTNILGEELCALLLDLPEQKHASLRRLILSALELQ